MDDKVKQSIKNAKRKLNRTVHHFKNETDNEKKEKYWIEIHAIQLLIKVMKREEKALSTFGESQALVLAREVVREDLLVMYGTTAPQQDKAA